MYFPIDLTFLKDFKYVYNALFQICSLQLKRYALFYVTFFLFCTFETCPCYHLAYTIILLTYNLFEQSSHSMPFSKLYFVMCLETMYNSPLCLVSCYVNYILVATCFIRRHFLLCQTNVRCPYPYKRSLVFNIISHFM